MTFEYSLAGKWLELLKEIAPGVKRVAVLRDRTEWQLHPLALDGQPVRSADIFGRVDVLATSIGRR
jgi:hypothetical protein